MRQYQQLNNVNEHEVDYTLTSDMYQLGRLFMLQVILFQAIGAKMKKMVIMSNLYDVYILLTKH